MSEIEVTWVFDCDGVLLDSNRVKTDAFRSATISYGNEVAEAVVRHHLTHGGISRFAKFERMFTEVLGREAGSGEMESLLDRFSAASRSGLAESAADPAAESLLQRLGDVDSLYVASGGAQDEVRWALERHGLARFFSGVYGSPATKHEILATLVRDEVAATSVFVGDSRLDMEVAERFGMRRVFVTHWTEFEGWCDYVGERPHIVVVDDLGHLLRLLRGDEAHDLAPQQRWVLSAL